MSISLKITSAIVSMVLLLGITVFGLQRYLVFTEFQQLEKEYAQRNIDRITNRFSVLLDTVDATVYDWSAWDSAYRFATIGDESFVEENLYPSTFSNYGLDIALLINSDLEVLWVGIYEFDPSGGMADYTDERLGHLLLDARRLARKIDLNLDINEQVARGFFAFFGEKVLFAMRPIYQSDGSGVAEGFILFGKTLSKETLERLQADVSLDFTIGNLLGRESLLTYPQYQFDKSDRGEVRIRHPFLDETSHESGGFLITMDVDKRITEVGSATTQRVIIAFVVIALLITLGIALWLHHAVILPIEHLKNRIVDMTAKRDYTQRTAVTRMDELGQLAQQFNSLMETVHQKSEELMRLSERDALTGLNNRMAMDKALAKEWNILRRRRESLSIMMIDVDYFKQYNDHFGHQGGDDCLRRVAKVISSIAQRGADMAVRYGGEEFMVILPGVQLEDARQLGFQLLKKIEAEGIDHPFSDHGGKVTISVGLASAIPDKSSTVEGLIRKADEALYLAKKGGRNRVCVAD
jgi:diguanylate cyclase (GGDEF)-like protein